MSRARSHTQDDWQAAAASETGSGCLSFYVLPPLAALIIAGFVAFVALRSPLTPRALPIAAHDSTMLLQTSAAPISTTLPPAQQFPDTGVAKPIWSFASDTIPASSTLSPVFTKEVQHWGNDIVRWASGSALDPNLVATIMQIESCGDPRATCARSLPGLLCRLRDCAATGVQRSVRHGGGSHLLAPVG